MKKIIIYSFALIFLLFTLGSGITIYHLFTTTGDLNDLIGMHEIADIPKELNLNVQKIKAYLYSSPDEFAANLDTIIELNNRIDQTVRQCHSCHHVAKVESEIEETEAMIAAFQERLSFFITTVSGGDWRNEQQNAVAVLAYKIDTKVEEMDGRVTNRIQRRTKMVKEQMDRAFALLAATLVATFIIALFVARYLTVKVTSPIEQLLGEVNKIRDGEHGQRIDYVGANEFSELIKTFNEMSRTIALREQRIEASLARLNNLSHVTLPLHTAHSFVNILQHVGLCIDNLIEVEQKGMMLVDTEQNRFVLHLSTADSASLEAHTIIIPLREVVEVFRAGQRKSILLNGAQDGGWPFGEQSSAVQFRNLLLVWLVVKNELVGALLAINKQGSDFSNEDRNVFEILANNIAVALENYELYKRLQKQMDELQQTQRQLFEAEKLTAIGTLAGGVAHDFNNILCGMIGHLAMLKKKSDPDSKSYQTIDLVEKAGFRAAGLIKQLLAFSRQEIVEMHPVDLNRSVQHIISILEKTFSKLITINLDLSANLPMVVGDDNQLEQVVMNLCVNSRDALLNGGTIFIKTEVVRLEDSMIAQYSWVRPGKFVKLSVIDTGHGINNTVLSRIFEPFFTTKEFGQGTGLGLAIVYGIVKSHKGFCMVDSIEGEGTTFCVYLPIADQLIRENPLAVVEWNSWTGTILIVDDEHFVSTMLAEYLGDLGCVTYVAHNGEEAIRLFNEKKDEIDIVILDINMPIMDGTSAFDTMKKIKPDVKVIVSSGYSSDGRAQKIMDGGAKYFIQKPYTIEAIAQTIFQVIAEENVTPPGPLLL